MIRLRGLAVPANSKKTSLAVDAPRTGAKLYRFTGCGDGASPGIELP